VKLSRAIVRSDKRSRVVLGVLPDAGTTIGYFASRVNMILRRLPNGQEAGEHDEGGEERGILFAVAVWTD
jgi:hypothetical protein